LAKLKEYGSEVKGMGRRQASDASLLQKSSFLAGADYQLMKKDTFESSKSARKLPLPIICRKNSQ
jgi:hypothetical protein